jgi:NADPH:quinone reductase-like Zn-dependent oxidoreductase
VLTDGKAATLPCAGVTAWNALNGLKGVPEGAYALLQGDVPKTILVTVY